MLVLKFTVSEGKKGMERGSYDAGLIAVRIDRFEGFLD
jgi:hypothetical protein